MAQPQTVPQYRKFFIQEGISPLEIKAKYGDLRLRDTWKKAYSEYTYGRLPIIQAIAQVERPQPQPQPQPIPRAMVNVASVLAKPEESSSTLDLFGGGNIPPVEQNAGKVLHAD
ncbi:hypothetical protein [Okeania sp. KiyG1]|uniref:hypothetical protein n=1 Tax=Okeania sp. KiyG1 TaxID=2720165 RepID=UPI0019216EFA|nr:hypothetical protein [Okeania sp. KiyG1]